MMPVFFERTEVSWVYCKICILNGLSIVCSQTGNGVLSTINQQCTATERLSFLSVRLLVAGTSRWTSILLGLATTRICFSPYLLHSYQQQAGNDHNWPEYPWSHALPAHQHLRLTPLTQLPTLLIEGNNSSRDSLTNSYEIMHEQPLNTIDLSNTTSSLDSNTNVEVSESLSSEKEHRLQSLHLEALRLKDVNRLTVQLHDSLSLFAMSHSNSSLLYQEIRLWTTKTAITQPIRTLRPKACTEGIACSEDISIAHFLLQ